MSPRKQPLPRVVIEDVRPQVDCGRHAIKRTIGEPVRVGAAIYKDGHDQLGARLLVKAPRARTWRSTPMAYEYNPDRWFAEFTPDGLGRWQYTIEAWPDELGTWQADLKKRLGAGQDLAGELAEGAAMLLRAAQHAGGDHKEALTDLARRFGDESIPLATRVDAALAADFRALLDGPLDPAALTRWDRTLEVAVDRERAGFGAWYELFPRSQTPDPARHGTFADAARRLGALAELGFDVVYLPPIHPIGHTHRKGRNNSRTAREDDPGSPWAIGSEEGGHTAVDPALGTLADFEKFVAEAERMGMEVALDYALQCSPDHPWVREHPDWFYRRPDGSIHYAENPPKKYEDIYPINFWCEDRESLWKACRDIFFFWIERGVKIFRVDNPHTKPFAFWQWCLGEVHGRHPDVILLSEAFTRPYRMKALAKIGFNQSYTYFTWKNTKWELTEYFTELTATEMTEYYRPNLFTNTPDILHEYLQRGGRAAFRVRLVLAATLSPSYGIYSGFELCENVPVREGSEEYLDSEKYQVRVRDWNAPGNLNDEIRLLNGLRREHPALQRLANLSFVPVSNEHMLCYRKSSPGDELLIVVNLDPLRAQETDVAVPLEELGIGASRAYETEDLLTGERYRWRGRDNYVRLDPTHRVAHVLRLPAAVPGKVTP